MDVPVRYRPLGDRALLIQLEGPLTVALNARVRALARIIEEARLPGVEDLIPAQNSLAVRYDPVRVDYAGLLEAVRGLAVPGGEVEPPPGKTVHIPIVYGGTWGPDLAAVAQRAGLTEGEVAARHSDRSYVVYMVGFSAGLPYLGDTDPVLWLPRRATPRLEVPAGSVGIAMNQSVIYTVASPGGWHIIGRTPMRTFDPYSEPPSLLVAGDTVRFIPIAPEDAEAWDEARQAEWDRRWNPWR